MEKDTLDQTKFSVLMAVYNGDQPEYLRQCLKSLRGQTLQANEILAVCDGMISCELEKVFSEFTDLPLRILRYQGREKLPGALNMGLAEASFDIVARMDADDISKPNRFAVQLPIFCKNKLAVLGSSISEFEALPTQQNRVRIVPKSPSGSDFYKRNPMNHMTVIYNRESVIEIGGYHFVEGFEDWHLWLRLKQKKLTFANIVEPLVLARVGNGFYQRRSGRIYAIREAKAYIRFYREKLIPTKYLLIGLLVRVPLRLLPIRAQQMIYSLMRKPETSGL